MFNYVNFVATKKGMTTNFFSPLSFAAVFGSGIRDPRWVKIWIWDKHPGSATLKAGSYGKMFAKANCCAAERAPRVHRVLVAQPPQARLAEDVAARISLKNTIIILKNEFLTAVLRIHMFLGLLDPDPNPLVRGMDPDPAPQSDSRILLSPGKKVRKTFCWHLEGQ
jgi:hypothetical protein